MTVQELLSHADELNSIVKLHQARIRFLESNADMSASAPVRLAVAHADHRLAVENHTRFFLSEWISKPCSNP